jgi:hypothetical protein
VCVCVCIYIYYIYTTMCFGTVILPVVLYGCETWSFILREERRLRVYEKRVPSRKFGPKQESGENYLPRSLMICTSHQISFG